jgi:hypothetical protein
MNKENFNIPEKLFDIGLNVYQGAICAYLFYCLNMESTGFPSYNLMAERCGMSKAKAISTVKELIGKAIIKGNRQIMNAEDKRNLLMLKNFKGLGIGDNTCDWCQGNTIVLHQHHFPILKANGGIQTVNICPNCHSEYHNLDKYSSDWEVAL